MGMKIIGEGLSQIKREPGASLKVIRAVQMLEEEVNGNVEDDIKPELKEPFEEKGEYFECDSEIFPHSWCSILGIFAPMNK